MRPWRFLSRRPRAGSAWARALTCPTSEAERGQGQQGEEHEGSHGVSGSGCVDSASLLLPASSAVLYSGLPQRQGCGRVTGEPARAVWGSSASALSAKPQRRLWLELWLPGQAPGVMEEGSPQSETVSLQRGSPAPPRGVAPGPPALLTL